MIEPEFYEHSPIGWKFVRRDTQAIWYCKTVPIYKIKKRGQGILKGLRNGVQCLSVNLPIAWCLLNLQPPHVPLLKHSSVTWYRDSWFIFIIMLISFRFYNYFVSYVMMEAAFNCMRSSVVKFGVVRDESPGWWRQYTPLKRRSASTWLHGPASQKTLNFILTGVRTWNLT
jgi:hypothetical protein